MQILAELLVLRDAVRGGRGLDVRVEARDLDPELLRVAVEVRLLEVALVREERVVHLPELALIHGRDGRSRRDVRVRVARQRVELEHHPDVVLVGLDDLLEHRGDLAAVRALEVGELDDRDRRALGPLHRRAVDRDVLEPARVEAGLVHLLDLFARHAVFHAAEHELRPGETLRTGALLLHALLDRNGHVLAGREELGDIESPFLFLAGGEGARIDPLEGHLGDRFLLRRVLRGRLPTGRPRNAQKAKNSEC